MDQEGAIRRPWTPLYGALSLPGGIAVGFVTVALSYRLRQEGLPVAAIAGLIGLSALPFTWRLLGGPMLDLSLTPRMWHLICTVILTACLFTLGVTPATAHALPLLGALALATGVATVLVGAAVCNIVGAVEPETERGPIGGWVQTGGLGGRGLGGGAGLWMTQHAGGAVVAAIVLSAVCLLCTLPLLTIRTGPRQPAPSLRGETVRLAGQVWALLRSRTGALALLLNLLPMGLGASNSLWAAVSGDWKASADMVALITGVLGGLAVLPGCLLGSALCKRFSPTAVYYGSAVAGAVILAGMACAPHVPWAFAVFTLVSGLNLGTTWSALSSVSYACIGRAGAATKAALLSSASNLPVVLGIAFVGGVQSRFGSNAMLWAEAGLAVVGLAAYTLVSRATAPRVAAAVEGVAS